MISDTRRVAALVFSVLTIASPSSRADWPEFRGPFGNGYVAAPDDTAPRGLPLTWSETENIRWKTPIPHRGWSTPVVMNGQVWLTTATEDGHDYFVLCLDADTGEILHNKKLFHSDNPEPLGNAVNCYAAPSPTIEPGRVYVHFGSYGTACLDTATGEVLWSRDDLPCRHYRGPSSSLVLFENLLIVTMDGADQQYVTALDKATGETVWRTDRDVEWNDQDFAGKGPDQVQMLRDGDHRKAHSTPLIVTAPDGRPQMLSGGAKAAFAYDPHTGHELWRIEFDAFSVAPRPLYQDGFAYLVTGTTNSELWAVRTDGRGDLTNTDHVTWRLKKGVPKTASPVLVDGLITMIGDEGVINCVDAATGELAWSKRLPGKFAASPIYGDGRLYFADQDGQTTVVKPGRKYEALATNTLDDGCMASPAVDGRALYLRTRTHLYRIEDTPSASN
jgi:outer membrane protein assembly factor BamB